MALLGLDVLKLNLVEEITSFFIKGYFPFGFLNWLLDAEVFK
jgi:hypothetical protein